MPLSIETNAAAPLGSPIALARKPLIGELWAFRKRLGYGGQFFATPESAARPAVQAPSLAERIAEAQRLLAAPDAPRARDAFDAFCLLLHLFMAVENKYLGPYNPRLPSAERSSLYKGGAFFSAARSGSGVVGMQREFCFLLDHENPIEIAFRGSISDMPFEVAENDRYAPMRAYVRGASRGAPAALPPKGERLEQFFAALAAGPAPEDRLQGLVLVNSLLGALENAHPSLAGEAGPARMLGVMPYVVQESSTFPGAAVLLSIAHVLCYYPDGTVEIYLRDPARDVKEDVQTTSIVLKALLGHRAGQGQAATQPQPELSPA